MKKHFSTLLTAASLLLLTVCTTGAYAQKKGGGATPAFDKGSSTLALGLGLGVSYGYYTSVSVRPTLVAYFDHGIVGNVGPGTIGIGGIVGYKSASYKYSGYLYGSGEYKSTWTDIIVGVRGTYHLTILKDKNNKFDPYAGVMVGMRFQSWKDTWYNHTGYDYDGSSVHPTAGAFVGAKYNFAKNFGAWAEVGYDVAFLKLGVNLNF